MLVLVYGPGVDDRVVGVGNLLPEQVARIESGEPGVAVGPGAEIVLAIRLV